MPTDDHTHSSTSETSACPSSVSNVQIKLPPFWHNDPTIWLAQVQAQFITRGITQQKTKFVYVVAFLQPEYAQEIWDLLISLPQEQPYVKLKAESIQRNSTSEQKRLHRVLMYEDFERSQTLPVTSQVKKVLG